MKNILIYMLCIFSAVVAPTIQAAPKKAASVCVDKIHVIKGCSACETMMEWLRQGGVKLEISHVEQGSYPLYPTVVYSDKTLDHGDRMYSQQVTIPGKICITSCSFGTN